MLWTLAAVLFVLWLLGLALKVAGAAIHVLLVVAAVLFIVHLIKPRRSVP